MDLSGPAQVFYEADKIGPFHYTIHYCGSTASVVSEQGLMLSGLKKPQDIVLQKGDFIFLPGFDFNAFVAGDLAREIQKIRSWLKEQLTNGVTVASICTGALALAEAGILADRKYTSHWKCIEYMRKHYPEAEAQIDQLYVNDRNVFTSAGMTSGIDMALSILELHHGPILPAKVAREMVVFMRRNSQDTQQTIYLDYRTHFNPAIHLVQDYILSNPGKNPTLEELATVGNVSVRNLTRAFKKATGHTIIEFKNAVKIELARNLVKNSKFTMEKIASLCGFTSTRQVRRILNKGSGTNPA